MIPALRFWQQVVPPEERAIFERAGFGVPQPFGERPALLIVDVVESFTGTRPMPVLEAIREYGTSCGESAWEALPFIRSILEDFRKAGLPVVFTKGDPNTKGFCGDSTKRNASREAIVRQNSAPIASAIAPLPEELVLSKTRASAFFATPLATYLHQQGVDSVFLCGTSTSGCVRATCVDAYSCGYRTFVLEEACFDRSRFFHAVSLFDMNAKYATVVGVDEARESIRMGGRR